MLLSALKDLQATGSVRQLYSVSKMFVSHEQQFMNVGYIF